MLLHWFVSSSWKAPVGVDVDLIQVACLLPRKTPTAHARETDRKLFLEGEFALVAGGDQLEVLAGGDGVDGLAAFAIGVGVDQGSHVHNALTLLARDLCPVVGVGRVR